MISTLTSAFTFMMFAIAGFAALIQYVMTSLGYMGCMKKAGVESWKAWIPVYNDYTMYKVVNLKSFLIIFKIIYIIIEIVYLSFTFAYIQDISERTDNIVNSYKSNSYVTTTRNEENRVITSVSTPKYSYDEEEELLDSVGSMSIGLLVFSLLSSAFGIAIFVIGILFAINISKAYGLGGGTIAGMILIPQIMILIVGFGSSKYQGEYKPTTTTETL